MKRRWIGLLSALAGSCTGCHPTLDVDSEFIYVPGPDFQQGLEIGVDSLVVEVGDELLLEAKRTSSGFVKIRPEDYSGGCYFIGEPPAFEDEVSLNVTWHITPKGQSYRAGISDSGRRTAVFSRPGQYRLRAHSALWCSPGAVSNEIEITVR
ncbi:hypothetical protein [Gallaecimonas sp. GXIMD4217]|uniref:hypothetical protein n=1 Tax=Gallaecimonas sp. GXIMD4217 TaxID=3131927 RepID=UPI00311B1A7F